VVGIFEKDNFMLCYQHGIFVATTRRLLFYGKFPYYPLTFFSLSSIYLFTLNKSSFMHIPPNTILEKNPWIVTNRFNSFIKYETVRAKHIQKGNV
ncbi:hypothetical protein ACT453_46690, partial [Bacillus sp. D-CC]